MSERTLTVRVGDFTSGLSLALIILIIAAATDMEPKHRAKEPYSFGVAIGCRIGGPAFCPKVPQ